MLVISTLMGVPQGSVYSNSLYIANGGNFGKDKRETLQDSKRELAVNWLLIMMDLGSFLAQLLTAIVLNKFYPDIVINPPG